MLSRIRFLKRLVRDLPQQVRLAYCLMRDPRVPAYTKLAFAGGLGALLSPWINIPEVIPGLGELDALAVTLLGLRLFIAVCPDAAVIEQEQLIIEQRSRFDDDVRAGERIALMLARRFHSQSVENERELVGNAQRTSPATPNNSSTSGE